MRKLIEYEIVLLPLYGLGIFISGRYISQSHIFALLISVLFGWLIFLHPKLMKVEVAWTLPFLGFLSVSFLGLLLSPFGTLAWTKGGIQLMGVSIMVVMTIAVIRSLQSPGFIPRVTGTMIISLAIFSLIGISQFLLLNFTSVGRFFNFSFLNGIAGGIVWRRAGAIGGIYRANSFAAEPAHFVRYLGLGLGLALLRLGVFGKVHRANVSKVVPLWASVAIIGGYFVALSIIGWLLLGMTGFTLFFLVGKVKSKSLLSAVGVSTILLVAILFIIIQQSGGSFADKFGTISIIIAPSPPSNFRSNQISALAVAANITVAENNFMSNPILGGGLGSHPLAYDKYAPSYVSLSPALDHLNADDAASLLVRLISETGMLGLILFVWGCLAIMIKARKIIVDRTKKSQYTFIDSISLGYLASFAGLLGIYLVRTGHYYDPVFWVSLAFVVAIPAMIKNNTTTL